MLCSGVQAIEANLEPWEEARDVHELLGSPLVHDPTAQVPHSLRAVLTGAA